MNRLTGLTGRFMLALGLILLLAFGLRFFRLDAQSFWNDEGNSARLSERSLSLIIEGTASDIHPPFYYLMLRGWRELLGESEFGLRSLSAFAGVLTVALTAAVGHALWGRQRRWATALAALLAAQNPALVYYSQETRMYALLALLATVTTWLLLRLGRRAAVGGPIAWLGAAYGLSAAAGLYTHYFFPAILVGHNVLALLWLGRRTGAVRRQWAVRWFGLMLAAALVYAPWLPVFWRQAVGRAAETGSLTSFLPGISRFLLQGETGAAAAAGAALLIVIVILGGLWLMWRRPDRRVAGTILLVSALAPLVFMLLAGTTRPAVFKFALVAVPPLCLLFGLAWTNTSSKARAAAALLTLLALALGGRSLANLYFNPDYARADYRGLAARITAAAYPNAGVILNAPNQWEVFTYYYEDVDRVYPLPRGRPDQAQIEAELTAIAAAHDRLYAIFWGEAERDPERFVERWLDANAFKASEEWVGDVRFVIYALPAAPAAAMTSPLAYPVGADITLLGYTLPQTVIAPGDVLPLTLFWQADRPVSERYKVFIHLVDEKGQLIAQRDSEPGGGLALTTTWPVGEEVRDNHGLLVPLTAAPGEYTLLMGVYDIADPSARLLIGSDDGPVDALPLATVTVLGQ